LIIKNDNYFKKYIKNMLLLKCTRNSSINYVSCATYWLVNRRFLIVLTSRASFLRVWVVWMKL